MISVRARVRRPSRATDLELPTAMMRLRSSALLLAFVSAAAAPPVATAEPPLVTLEGALTLPLTDPQSRHFGPGGMAAAAGLFPLGPHVLVGARLRLGMLADGDPPRDPAQADPGNGTLESLEAVVRLRPVVYAGDERMGVGPFVGLGAGGGITGHLVRPTFSGGVGWGFDLGAVGLAPVVRYVQVVHPSDPISDEDARLLLAGVEVVLLERRPPPPPPPAPPVDEDMDDDGLVDREDQCPTEPEDHDGHADADGCPDPDNDGDGILDGDDQCPDEAEDADGFQDADGCPDPDNDADGFLDADDQCPDDAEIVNGNEDYDGCPDEGLIEFKDDRIVLEERVLFDFERARIKTRAKPILRAIVKLVEQHPEWIRMRIEGHADTRGNEEYNLELSQRRADHVRGYLVKLGIPDAIIESQGYGATKPRDLRGTEEAHHRNRRVEFVVVARHPSAVPGTGGTAGAVQAPAGGAPAVETPQPAEGAAAVETPQAAGAATAEPPDDQPGEAATPATQEATP